MEPRKPNSTAGLTTAKEKPGLAQEIELLRRAGEVVKVEPQETFNLYGQMGVESAGTLGNTRASLLLFGESS